MNGGIWPLKIFSVRLIQTWSFFRQEAGSDKPQQFPNDGADKENVDKDSTVIIPVHSYKEELICGKRYCVKNVSILNPSINYLENLKRPQCALWYCHTITLLLHPDISDFTSNLDFFLPKWRQNLCLCLVLLKYSKYLLSWFPWPAAIKDRHVHWPLFEVLSWLKNPKFLNTHFKKKEFKLMILSQIRSS